MYSKLQQYPIYLFLLPVFFILHGYLENFGFITAGESAILCLSYLAGTIIIAAVCWLYFRNTAKAALVTVSLMAFYFFFGALHEFLKINAPRFFSKYAFLLTTFLLLITTLVIYLRKNRSLKRVTAFLNVLLIIYIVVDGARIFIKAMDPAGNSLSTYSFAKNNSYTPCDTCNKPDIYLLLMDEYPSSVSLAQHYNYKNELDDFLIEKKFSIQKNSRANYNFTPFSMASILNMSYIRGIKNAKAINGNDYASCELLIRNNEVISLLNAAGYSIENYSIFDLAGHPSMVQQQFLPLNTRLITERTLFAKVKKDIGWKLFTWHPFKWFASNDIMVHNRNNQLFIEQVNKSTTPKAGQPRFIYAHFYMPHQPYYYDKNGKLYDLPTIIRESRNQTLSLYLEYITYVNGRIKEMITAIQKNNPSAVIVLMGDHGRREKTRETFPERFFQNLNAVYYPDNDYTLLYDNISGVNQFRMIFNKLFNQSLPVLKDSSIYLIEKSEPGHN
ncbi:sulfatase-like hydrolase/transferase [Longitalea luteola]|uniref:sulfatase-like hydrolase/transferase n=1 Tax=Longitalea luteola TaxID=2812563 RepID=UPI001A961564|nr:sulfatase-like hydrolase/transferase [Longitalea luteola]